MNSNQTLELLQKLWGEAVFFQLQVKFILT